MVFEQPGLGPDEMAWIARDQYAYFVTQARERGNPRDWPAFRDGLVRALDAAWGLGTVWSHLDADRQARHTAERYRRGYEAVDLAAARHDPVADWHGFVEALWDQRQRVLADVDG